MSSYATNGMPEWLTKGNSEEAGRTEYLKRLIAIGRALDEAKALLTDPDGKDLVAAILAGYRNGQGELKKIADTCKEAGDFASLR